MFLSFFKFFVNSHRTFVKTNSQRKAKCVLSHYEIFFLIKFWKLYTKLFVSDEKLFSRMITCWATNYHPHDLSPWNKYIDYLLLRPLHTLGSEVVSDPSIKSFEQWKDGLSALCNVTVNNDKWLSFLLSLSWFFLVKPSFHLAV